MVTAFKGFDADLRCRGFQYEVGQTYRHDGRVEACGRGFHACENPLDVWSYYPIVDNDGRLARYAEVELGGAMDRREDKIAAGEITIKAELNLPDFVRRAVDAIIAANKGKDDGGNYAKIGSSGNDARIGSSGYGARIGSSGNYTKIGSSGNDARIGSSGYGARIGSSGNYTKIGSSGNDAKIGSSGYGARIVCDGDRAVVASAGQATTVSGKAGTWISLACYDDDGNCTGFATGCIGQDGLKPDTPYRAINGKLVEAEKE